MVRRIFENSEAHGIYLKFSLIMKYYDESTIKKHIEKIIKRCSLETEEKSFNCLGHYLEFETEEREY